MEQTQIDRILESNNIVDVISSYFPLKKSGSNYKARCPFHDEKTPSFVVSEKKQIFKCFGCGVAGNAITFVRDYEKISFMEAVKKLAARVGITIAETKTFKKDESKRDLIYKIYALTSKFFHDNLQKYGTSAKEYLLKRGFSSNLIEKFEIGYSLDSYAGLKNFLIKNNINNKILEKTGLFSKRDNEIYDIFRNRLMFPIHSITGKVVAFGGRVLQDDQPGGKYINSPTTDIYTKGNELYGLFLTRYEISKKDFVLISEGYTDFLRLYENGFLNSVASLGTSLTDAQISLVSRYTQNFYLVYDGDAAGRKAATRAASNVIQKGFNARIITLPETEDPGSFLINYDKEEFQTRIDEAKIISTFLLDDESMNLNKREKINLLVEVLNEMEDPISRELFVKEIADVFTISEQSIYSKIRTRSFQIQSTVQNISIPKYEEERDLLKIILNEKSYYKKVAKEIESDYFLSKIYRNIYEKISEHIENINQISALLEITEDEIEKNTIAEILMEDIPNISYEEIIKAIKLRKYRKDLQAINEQIVNNSQNKELFLKKAELKKKIIGLGKQVVRKTLY